jgi:hypothetical protein
MKQLLMGKKSKKEAIQIVDQEDTQLKKDMKLG